MAYPQIIFIRHGQTDWNAEGRFQGQLDVPLNQTGVNQARRNGKALGEYFNKNNRKPSEYNWVSSPQTRAKQTMELILESMSVADVDYELEAKIMEVSYGIWEGHTGEELKELDPNGFAKRKLNKWEFTPNGGESYKSAAERVEKWLKNQDRPVVATSHGGISRILRGCLFAVPEPLIPELAVPQDRILICNNGEGAWI